MTQITLDLTAILENLNFGKLFLLRLKRKTLFEYAAGLKKQRNWIIHGSDLPKSRLRWKEVWITANSKLEDNLLPQLNHAIEYRHFERTMWRQEKRSETKERGFNIDQGRRQIKVARDLGWSRINFRRIDNRTNPGTKIRSAASYYKITSHPSLILIHRYLSVVHQFLFPQEAPPLRNLVYGALYIFTSPS